MSLLVGIDVGLSYLKVGVFDRVGRLVAHGQAAYRVEHPAPDRAEQDPEQWIDLAGGLLRGFIADRLICPDHVAGIAGSGRGSGAIFVDSSGRVLAPDWLDGRSAPQARALHERFGPESNTRSLASKTLHLKEVHPDLFSRLAHPLFVKDFLLYRMSGVVATDPSSGPRTADYGWARDAWEWIGVEPPPVRQHTEIVGTLLPETAGRLGLPAGIPVAVGGHDGACANTGAGAIAPGQVCMTMGTNVVARSISTFPAPQVPWRGISAYHFLPGRWCCGGDAGYAGATPTWLASTVGRGHAELEADARLVPAGAGGVVFLPFFRGQIAPEMRPEARGAFLGLAEGTGRVELYRATLEGVAHLYRTIADRLAELGLGGGDTSGAVGGWRVSGGGARNGLWMEIMASMLERRLIIVEPEEGPRGAAMMAAVGLGLYPSIDACASEWVRTVRVIEPDRDLAEAYQPHHERYRSYAEAVWSAESAGQRR